MARIIITDEARELHMQFREAYSFIDTCKSKNINLLYDYVLSQDMAEEVEL